MIPVTERLYNALKVACVELADAGYSGVLASMESAINAYEQAPHGYVEYTHNGKFYTGVVFETDEGAYMKAKLERMMNIQEEEDED